MRACPEDSRPMQPAVRDALDEALRWQEEQDAADREQLDILARWLGDCDVESI